MTMTVCDDDGACGSDTIVVSIDDDHDQPTKVIAGRELWRMTPRALFPDNGTTPIALVQPLRWEAIPSCASAGNMHTTGERERVRCDAPFLVLMAAFKLPG